MDDDLNQWHDEFYGAFIYFSSDAPSYTTGQYLAFDGGWTTLKPLSS